MDSSLPLPSHPPLLTPALLPPSPFLPHHHSFTAGPQLATAFSRKSTPLTQSQNCAMECRRSFLLQPCWTDRLSFWQPLWPHFAQETHLSSTKTFQIPDYYTLRTDRNFGRQGPVSSGTHNTGGVLTLIHSDLAFSPVSVSSLSSQDPYSDYTCVKVLLSNHSPLQFLNLYSPPSETVLLILAPGPSILTSFLTPLTLSSSETSMLTTQRGTDSFPPNPLGNDLFRWITSSGLEILNDPASPTLLHHSTGSRSSPDILLAPASLALHCEWRTLHGLGSDHLPIEIVLPFFPVRQPNHTSPKFNYKKTSWDIYQSYIAEHLPSLDFDALNIHQAAHSSSLFLVEAAKASIPFGRLGRSPQSLVVPGSGICSSGTTEGPLRGTPIWVAPPQIHRCFS